MTNEEEEKKKDSSKATKGGKKDKGGTGLSSQKKKTNNEADASKIPVVPPVVAAGRRLERLLTVAGPTSTSFTAATSSASVSAAPTTTRSTAPHNQPMATDSATHNAASLASNVEAVLHSNPCKIVRRWLGTSSGTAARATMHDLALAATLLLDPDGPCRVGREIVISLQNPVTATGMAVGKESDGAVGAKDKTAATAPSSSDEMDVDKAGEAGKSTPTTSDAAASSSTTTTTTTTTTYLSAAAREYEAWLISLAVRILLRRETTPTNDETGNNNDNDGNDDAAFEEKAFRIASKGIAILSSHMDDAARATARAGAAGSLGKAGGGAGGLNPLLARMHRYRGLAAGAMETKASIKKGGRGGGGDGIGGAKAAVTTMLSPLVEMRSEMALAYRMACLRRDVDTQATLLNLLLRDLLNANQVEQAQKLLSNSTFPDSASNNQLCRYLYHSGRIQALRLEYTSAFSNLSQCLRKAPTNTGLGFRIAVQRLLVVVQLLMGEIPDRNVFFTEGMVGELGPYLKITQAVRRGDLAVFEATVAECASRLREDGTYTLISRLAHSVVKAGLRRLDASYSRISLVDVSKRLGLPCAESAEFVIAKAVRDGVIDATIDHEGGYVRSHDLVDVYATTEPAEAFHRRIAYCLTTHNDAVRGMRYPPDAYKRQLEASRGLKGKKGEDKTDEEKAQELEEEFEEDY